MARPTLKSVFDAARAHMGDTAISGGQYATDDKLLPYYQIAYSELFRAMDKSQSPRDKRVSYYDLPAYTSVLDPVTAGVFNMAEIESVEERGSVTELAIATVTASSPTAGTVAVMTAAPHGFSTGDQIVQFGIQGMDDIVNGLFTVTVPSGLTYYANGCTALGLAIQPTGTAAKSTEQFTEVVPLMRATDMAFITGPQTILGQYAWENNLFWFPPCSAIRQLRITYSLSGQAPTLPNSTIPIDDSGDFLAARTAGLALQARGNKAKADALNFLAVGAHWADGVMGGLLDQLLGISVRNLQRLPSELRRIGPWRRHWRGRNYY